MASGQTQVSKLDARNRRYFLGVKVKLRLKIVTHLEYSLWCVIHTRQTNVVDATVSIRPEGNFTLA